MAYLGATKTGAGAPIPMLSNGALDINSLIGQMVCQQKTYNFDTLKIPAGTTVAQQPYRMFQTPVGQPDPYNGNIVKTALETSMSIAGSFAPPTDFILNNLFFYFLAGNQEFDIEQIINHMWFEFIVNKKVWWSGHLQRHPSGMGLTGVSNVATDAVWTNGLVDPRAIWHFGDWKLYIPPNVQFSLLIHSEETYDNYYNVTGQGGAAINVPADIQAKLNGVAGFPAIRPTLQTQAQGGHGIQIICGMNGISNGPVS